MEAVKKILVSILVISVLLLMSQAAFAVPENISLGTSEKLIMQSPDNKVYNDLSADWYRASAEKYGYPEIFASDGHFYPDKAITRMEFARMLHKALEININYFAPTDIGEYFSDVTNKDEGADVLYDLAVSGIVDDKGRFRPEEELSREDMIHYVINALKYVTDGQYALIKMMPAPFDDDAAIRDDYRNDIIEAVLLKLIKGRGENMLYPKESATRAEAAVVTDRLVELKERLVPDVKVSVSAKEENGRLKMSLTIANTGDTDVTINHNSGQKFDFVVLGSDDEVLYTWSDDKFFTMALTSTVIGAGKNAEFTAEIDSETYKAIKDKATFVKAYIVGSSDDFDISSYGYVTEIK